jgi:nitronate monooxygenase
LDNSKEVFDMMPNSDPIIIQGGMGAAVSGWRLARAVSQMGQMGVVSGTALDTVLVRRLQLGDAGGHMRRALAEFPFPEMAERILDRYFIMGGKAPEAPFIASPVLPIKPSHEQLALVVAANFVEVHLAKEDHDGMVGINYLEKLQSPTLPSLFGAMLAGVDYVLMGAGIPRTIPGILDGLSEGVAVELPLHIAGAGDGDEFVTRFDPVKFTNGRVPWLERPKFLAIIASSTLATMLARKANGRVDGFVVEGPTAGGHNAPPRGKITLNKRGEPIYGDRDVVDLDAIKSLGLPFWLAGSYGTPRRVVEALDGGATGVQVGTVFAFCAESGMDGGIKQRVLQMARTGELDVFTDHLASPTGFPFKVLRLDGTLSDELECQQREQACDLGFLRQGYRRQDGTVGWRCPAEPVASYLRKGGMEEDTVGRKCVCNGLMANVGLGQIRRDGQHEKPLVTCGNAVNDIASWLRTRATASYSAGDVVQYLLSFVNAECSTLFRGV